VAGVVHSGSAKAAALWRPLLLLLLLLYSCAMRSIDRDPNVQAI